MERKNRHELNGSWRAVYAELDGEMVPVKSFSGTVIHFDDEEFKIEKNGEIHHAGVYSVNNDVEPAEITYTYSKSSFYEVDKPRVGIVQLTGDTLKNCIGGIGDKPPAGFNTSRESSSVMTIHQRVGSEKGIGLAVSASRRVSEW